MVAAYQSTDPVTIGWYPVTIVPMLVKKGKANVNKESNCCTDKTNKETCVGNCGWSPLMSVAYHGKEKNV